MKVPGNFSNNKDSTLKSESSYKAGDLTNVAYDKMDDNNYSQNVKNRSIEQLNSSNYYALNNSYSGIIHSSNIYSKSEIQSSIYTKTFRFGINNPYSTISYGREYLFFTKPDLNIIAQTNNGGETVEGNKLYASLQDIPFWVDIKKTRKNTIEALEYSYKRNVNKIRDPFNHLLQNTCVSNLDVPALSAEVVDTATNMYGVGYSYRGSSEASDDNPEFSLEFRDTRNLDVYYYFKAYEEYETLKHHGIIAPSLFYIENRIIHDQFSIYKFIVDEDMETIIYYGKMYGVMPKSLPRDVFSNPVFDDGLKYSIDFRAAFYEDMKPDILSDFNKLSAPLYKTAKYKLKTHNPVLDRPDMRLATAAYVVKDTTSAKAKASPTKCLYKLKWKGDDKV